METYKDTKTRSTGVGSKESLKTTHPGLKTTEAFVWHMNHGLIGCLAGGQD
jgi:hypothetical protein